MDKQTVQSDLDHARRAASRSPATRLPGTMAVAGGVQFVFAALSLVPLGGVILLVVGYHAPLWYLGLGSIIPCGHVVIGVQLLRVRYRAIVAYGLLSIVDTVLILLFAVGIVKSLQGAEWVRGSVATLIPIIIILGINCLTLPNRHLAT